MFDCLRHIPERICGARELESSHAGGNDYSAPCVLNVNAVGKHKGLHRTAGNVYSWKPNEYDRYDEEDMWK